MILNLTQHTATLEQKEAGVVDLPETHRRDLKILLTFDEIPPRHEIEDRAHDIALLAVHNDLGPENGDDPHPAQAMIGGAPFLMTALEDALRDQGVEPVYAFSRRESVEKPDGKGGVIKSAVFRHMGFVKP